ASEIKDPQGLALKLWVNDVLKQDSHTSKMIFTLAEQISHLSSRLTLHPGDLVLTGTPAGVGAGRGEFLKAGDVVKIWIEKIGEFKEKGEFYAYSNFCLHQGGPACEGLTIAKVEERIMPDKTSRGLYFSETELHFVCPWHGMEYDMKTGECVSDRKMKLRKYKIVQKGDDIYVAT